MWKNPQIFSGTHWLVALVALQVVEESTSRDRVLKARITAIGALYAAPYSQLLGNRVKLVILGQG